MDSRFIEFNGKLYQVQTRKVDSDYVTEILDNGTVITNFISRDAAASDDQIKQELQSKFRNVKNLELED
jgi:hypothetical protein